MIEGTTSPQPAASSATPARILIVDDEPPLCDICSRALTRVGYDVVATTDVDVALRELRGDSFDLLLTDIKMPTISGLELARIAREIDPAIAIIIMTGYTSEEHLRQAVQRGAADFMSKPFELEELRLAVDQALDKRRLLQDSVRLRSVERLLASSETINSTLDRAQIAQIILDSAQQHTGARVSFLLLRDGRRRMSTPMASDANATLLPAGRALAEQAERLGHPLSGADEPLCAVGAQPLHVGIALPMRAHGETLGTLLVCDERAGKQGLGAQESVALLANQAGAALRNAALYRQVQESNQRLQDLDRLKSEFIAIASHELRTPLSIVLGYTMMVRDQSSGDHREYLQRVMDGAQRIKDIIDDMVGLRHLENGEAQLNLQPNVLQNLVAQAVERMQPAARAKAQQLTTSLPEQPINLMADREKLLLIFGNLVSNAIKFTPDRGAVEVRAEVWSRARALGTGASMTESLAHSISSLPEELDQGEWVVVQVRDTGIGIPEVEQRRIFERFYQVADSLTREHGGTGLGLTIVQELVALQNGVVWVESRQAQGSTFSFAIPFIPLGSDGAG
jgi:signal transduction histidine kinase